MPHQLSHSETNFTKITFPVTLVCDAVRYQPNIGSLFRICEAFGVQEIIFIGKDVALTPRKINRTSRNTHLHIPYTVTESPDEAIACLQQNDYEIIALEITGNSKPLQSLSITGDKPIALIAGGEVSGIGERLLKIAHRQVHISMYGNNSSMNVTTAVAIALYHITNKIS